MEGINIRRTPEGGMRPSRPEFGPEPEGQMEMPEPLARPRRAGRGPWVLALTIIVVAVVLGVVFRDRLFKGGGAVPLSSSFYAVFLTNGQVYFGKVANAEEQYVTLENIYYLQITPVLQTKTEGDPGTQPPPQQQLSLVKLGNELHGPVDKMFVNRDQVLFLEELKEDGRVVQAIKDFEQAQQK